MNQEELQKYYNEIKSRGLSSERETILLEELRSAVTHEEGMSPRRLSVGSDSVKDRFSASSGIYGMNDPEVLQALTAPVAPYTTALKSIDELLERDKKREEDGFPRKIRVGRLLKPGKGRQGSVVVVPTTVEEKFIHDPSSEDDQEDTMGGAGEGEEGEVIGEQPIHAPDMPGSEGPGEGEGGAHELESSAYDLGKILTEKFQLPNLKDKGSKRSVIRYTYDMTDKNRGFGQILDKKATLRKILETNMSLGKVPDVGDIDPTGFLISPSDKIYRVLSREKDYESQAVVFFVRDYSGSMAGKATTVVVAQHILIYSWLLYQYSMQVESRFILHDTDAKEVPDFYTYYNSKVAGGTKVASGFRLVNEIIEKENLAREYNIYIFHGTDGDDWDTDGKETVPELKKSLAYANRTGISIARHSYGGQSESEVEKYLKSSGLLNEKANLLRLDVMPEDADEPRLIEGIKHLISE
ncbi:MAG: DUF444 family protein [Thermodesulfobacteriota bacterium]